MNILLPGIDIPMPVFGLALMIIIIIFNLKGVDMFAKIQNFVAYSLIISLIIMGLIGMTGFGLGQTVTQTTQKPFDLS